MNPVSATLGVLVLLLFGAGVASFVALFRGCFVLRGLARKSLLYDGARLLRSPLVPGISIIAAPRDASARSRAFVRRLLDLQYGTFEVILALNGPSEADRETWKRELRLSPSAGGGAGELHTTGVRGIYESADALRLVVTDQEPGDEADALNAGVNLARFPVVAVIDEECEFDSSLLLRMVVPMLESPERTVAVCTGGPASHAGGLFGGCGALESLRAWLGCATLYTSCDMAAPVARSAVLIAREAILEAGGFRSGVLELLVHLHGLARRGGKDLRIAGLLETGSRTRAARSLAELRARVDRDQLEIRQLWRRRYLLPGGVRALGWGLPALLCVRVLRPAAEATAYVLALVGWLAGWVEPALAGLVLLTTAGTGMVVSVAAVALREVADVRGSDPRLPAGLFLAAIPENLGYRQLRTVWQIAGLVRRAEKSPGTGARLYGPIPRL